jgi:hypothetical protein
VEPYLREVDSLGWSSRAMARRTARPRRTIRNPSRPAAAAGASKASVEGGVTRGVPWMPRTSPEDEELVVVDDTPPDSLVVVSLVDVLVLDSLDWLLVSLVEVLVLELEDEFDDVSLVDVLVLDSLLVSLVEVELDSLLVEVLVLDVEDEVSLVDVLVLELDDVVVVSVQLSELDFEV